MDPNTIRLLDAEGWERREGKVWVYGRSFPVVHPCLIHLKLYRVETNPEIKFRHMKAAHDYLWPQNICTWNYWTERRFREHCGDKNYIGWAGGSSTGKSNDAALIALMFWLAAPKKRAVIIASTTLESLGARVWGYATKFLSSMKIKMNFTYLGGNSPKILPAFDKSEGQIRDSIHGIFAVAAKQGSDESAISSWIGRHPEDALMVILDECTDLNPAISKAFVNLDSSEKPFQLIAIGNSNSFNDLHGAICYPKDGIDNINPEMIRWETTQKNGVCLFFSCYESPAVHELDPAKKKLLSRFLITQEQITEKEKLYGKDSESFSRFVLGFWKSKNSETTIVSENFLELKRVSEPTEWSGLSEVYYVAGLDAAFSTGGDQCLLQLAMLGQNTRGNVVLDFKGEELLFKIPIVAKVNTPAEIQIANKVVEILQRYRIPCHHLVTDANGQGRAIAGTIMLSYPGATKPPIKMYSVKTGIKAVNSVDVVIKNIYDLWTDVRSYMETDQIRGLNSIAMQQFGHRLITSLDARGKPTTPQLESKAAFKKRMGSINPSLARSPDEADAVALCLQSAIENFGFKLGETKPLPTHMDFASQKYWIWKQGIKLEQQEHKAEPISLGVGFDKPLTDFIVKTRF